ncbi:coatomer subunit beta [Tubulinosema ratisbonensis]|uniref:Coatomer subunit beta n=1 Tax=Tubulinosema ratisbonensis TaxID=291195 RepID=A0A437AN72_9MICR|nr:coatomer subunit beta [Tubulinosema ratisbonensis]
MATFYYSGEVQPNYIRNLTINLPADYKKIHEIMRSHSDIFSLDLLLYIERYPYYLDDIFFSDALVFPNYLRRMSLHPNEFFRGKTLKIISNIESNDILSTLIKPIEDNLYHTSEYVRRNAYLALSQLFKYKLIDYDINNLLENENDPINRYLLYKINNQENNLQNICETGIILQLNEKENIKLAEENLDSSSNLLKLHSILHFLRFANLEREELTKFVEKMFEILKNSNLKFMRVHCLKEIFGLGIESTEVLNLYENGNLELNQMIFDYVRKNNKIIEVINLYNYILNVYEGSLKDTSKNELLSSNINLPKFYENNTSTKLMILEMIKTLVEDTYCYNDNNDLIINKYIQDDNPEVQFKCLETIEEIIKRCENTKIKKFIVNNLDYLKFGKIVRKTIDILKKSSTKDEIFSVLNHFKTEKGWFVAQVYNFIKENKEEFLKKESELKSKTITLLLSLKDSSDSKIDTMVNLVLRTIIKLQNNKL